jgi:hypothetical protein
VLACFFVKSQNKKKLYWILQQINDSGFKFFLNLILNSLLSEEEKKELSSQSLIIKDKNYSNENKIKLAYNYIKCIQNDNDIERFKNKKKVTYL